MNGPRSLPAIVDAISSFDLQWPTVSEKDREANERARRQLEEEPD